MSIATEISRIQTDRNTIRNKMIEFGLADSTANLDTLAAVAAHLNCELSELVTGVSVLQGRYLEGELAQLVDQMDGRQRKMLLEVAKLILAE